MANYSTLKAAVAAVVKTNGEQAITGANMQTVLLSIINSIGGGYIFEGVATPSTNAGTPDQNVFYIGGAGTYANFGASVVVPPTNIAVFKYNGSWVCEQVTVENGGVFDISAFHAVGGTLTTYADLAAALGTNGANVPESVRKGGMSIKYVQTYDNKYVQYMCKLSTWSSTPTDWEKVNNVSVSQNTNTGGANLSIGSNIVIKAINAGFQFKGVADTSTNPGSPDEKVFYIAKTTGTFTNFSNIQVNENELALLKFNGSLWLKDSIPTASISYVDAIKQGLVNYSGNIVVTDSSVGITSGVLLYNDGRRSFSKSVDPVSFSPSAYTWYVISIDESVTPNTISVKVVGTSSSPLSSTEKPLAVFYYGADSVTMAFYKSNSFLYNGKYIVNDAFESIESDIESIESDIESIESDIESIESSVGDFSCITTADGGFFICDSNGNYVFRITEDGLIQFEEVAPPLLGKKITVLGDSMTEVTQFTAKLAEETGATVVNCGKTGSHIAASPVVTPRTDFISRLNTIPVDSDMVIVFGGTNDFGHYGWDRQTEQIVTNSWSTASPFGSLDDGDTLQYTFYSSVHNLFADLYEQFHQNGIPVVVMTPLHRYDNTSGVITSGGDTPEYIHNNDGTLTAGANSVTGKTLKEYVDAIKEVANYYSFPVIDSYAESGINPNVGNRTLFTQDGIHLSVLGSELLAKYVAPFVEMYIKTKFINA